MICFNLKRAPEKKQRDSFQVQVLWPLGLVISEPRSYFFPSQKPGTSDFVWVCAVSAEPGWKHTLSSNSLACILLG